MLYFRFIVFNEHLLYTRSVNIWGKVLKERGIQTLIGEELEV